MREIKSDMSYVRRSKFDEFIGDANFHKKFESEALLLEATELVAELMERQGLSKAELAGRLGTSKAYVTQVLSGSRNMTLHTLAGLLFALGHKATVEALPLAPTHRSWGSSYRVKDNLYCMKARAAAPDCRQFPGSTPLNEEVA